MSAQRGAVSLALTWWSLALLAVALAVVAGAVDLAAGQASARTAADAAALAGAGAHPVAGGDGDVCGAARRLAEAGGARLVDCGTTGQTAAGFRVRVRVVTDVGSAVAAVTGPIEAIAVAGLAPQLPMNRTEHRQRRTAGNRHVAPHGALDPAHATSARLTARTCTILPRTTPVRSCRPP